MTPFLVCEFDKSTFSNLVKECFGSFFPEIFSKKQINYLYRYLHDVGAKSILLEREYIDKDYLEDYSRYYVKCFNNNGHKCARLHFFNEEVTHASLEALIENHDSSAERVDLNRKYLGFIVIKPLPQTFIGKTCVKLYPHEKTGPVKKLCISRNYDVDLFGIKLQIESIAFQEQDKVVSACAATSIWSALHALKSQNLRDIPACSEITTNAINHINGSNNSFPSKELSNKQILRALDIEHLRYHTDSILPETTQEEFTDIVRCHIDSGIPLILGVTVYSIEQPNVLKTLAGHAITILGYKFDEMDQTVYVHDDRLGPYARATFRTIEASQLPDETDITKACKWGLVLQEKNDDSEWQEPQELFLPSSLIIPTHRKIRLPAWLARNTCETIISEYARLLNLTAIENIRYDLRLEEISAIKQRLIASAKPLAGATMEESRRDRTRFLTGSYARYQWIANFFLDDVEAFSILFDATDIPQGNAVSYILIDNKEMADIVLAVFRKTAVLADGSIHNSSKDFFGSFLKCLTPRADDYMGYLDRTYGEVRAPRYLKPKEFEGGRVNGNTSIKLFYDSSEFNLNHLLKIQTSHPGPEIWIWAIAHDGALLIGEERGEKGHPTLTGFKPARIAGELKWLAGKWYLNAKSGRYSGDYPNRDELLGNALGKFKSIFPASAEILYCAGADCPA